MIDATRQATILHIDDEPDFLATWAPPLRRAGYDPLNATTLRQARDLLAQHFVDLLLVDERIGYESGTAFLAEIRQTHPGLGAIIVSGHADLGMAVRAMELGALSVIAKPFPESLLLEKVRVALENSALAREARYQRWHAAESGFPGIVGQSEAIAKVLASVRKVAPTQSTVLIQGESGTGKELVARAIHTASGRRAQRFQAENLGAITPSLAESTLFGHARGSFTGATTERAGLFEAANRGTLFLDEIGEATPEVQVRLLRALEQRAITRIGETTPRPVDVRLVAATNRDLLRSVQNKTFREDLYYRLQVVVIDVPPLRDRPEDIEPLASFLLSQQNRIQGKHIEGFSPAALRRLMSYHWPGNVRELRNTVENAVIHAEGMHIEEDGIVLRRPASGDPELAPLWGRKYRDAVLEFDRLYFGRLLQQTNNNKTAAAARAGLDRTSLHDHLRKLESRSKEDPEA